VLTARAKLYYIASLRVSRFLTNPFFFFSRFQPLERPKSEVPATSGTGLQSSHLAIRYDPKLEQPRSGVRAVPIAQAKQPSSSSTTASSAQHDVNRVIVQKPEPIRYHQQQQPQQHQLNNSHPHRSSSSDDHHHRHHKRPASVQPSYLDSRPFQIKPYDGGGGGNNNSNGSSSNGSSGSGGQSSSASSYHRPFAVTPQPLPPSSSQASPAIIVSGMDHRWTAFDGRAPPAFLQQSSSSSSAAAAAVINGYHHQHHRPPSMPPSTSTSLPATVVSQHHQHHSLSRQQQQSQHYPLNLHKLTQPARPATAAGQLQQVSGAPRTCTIYTYNYVFIDSESNVFRDVYYA